MVVALKRRLLLHRWRLLVLLVVTVAGVSLFLVLWRPAKPPIRLLPFREPPWAFLAPSRRFGEPPPPSLPTATPHRPLPVVEFVHQTWSSTTLPPRMATLSASWQRCFPFARHLLWTDADNRRLVREHYPWFASRYAALPAEIYRADAVRYLLLFHYGGVYADLDTECLRPFSHLLVNHSIVLGAMEEPQRGPDTMQPEPVLPDGLVQNSFMYSRPRHPFWLEMVHYVLAKPAKDRREDPEDVTGPRALMYVLRDYRRRFPEASEGDIAVYPPRFFNPFSWMLPTPVGPCRDRNQMSDEQLSGCRKLWQDTSYVVQYHFHTWKLPENRE